jgi:hypothetical protein
MRLARAGHRGNAEPPAGIAEDVLLGGSRGEGGCHIKLYFNSYAQKTLYNCLKNSRLIVTNGGWRYG